MSETTTIPLGQLHRNDYNPRFARERHGGDVDVDIDSLADSIRNHGLASSLSVRETDEGFEVIAGERRLLALKETHKDDYQVPVTIRDLDRDGAMELAFEENEERESLTPMDEAWHFAERVTVIANGEPMAYSEYAKNVRKLCAKNCNLVSVGKNNNDVEAVADQIDRSAANIAERLSFLLLPKKAQNWIDTGDLTKRAARLIVQKCRANIDDPQDALDMMADLAETYGPDYGGMSNADYDALKDDIKNRIEDYQRRKEIAEEEVEELANLVVERIETLSEDIDSAAEQFDVSSVPSIPDNPDSPRDINFEEIQTGVEEYRDDLEARRSDLIDRIDEFENEADQLQTETGRMKQAVQHFDEEDGTCPYCQQILDPDDFQELRERIQSNTKTIDDLRSGVHQYDDDLDALSNARRTLHRDVQRIEGALESYEEAYEKAMEFDSEVVE